ncbi:sigma-70 family RNA polymerase sigma factor [Mariniflexile sp. HMF6888]|uniref:sigma-70 family RNA polymerase sigma factor n=1 Tax=Mariniflexile sp. HMF6888 TaxID=3373086 RepID=UPI00378A3FE8
MNEQLLTFDKIWKNHKEHLFNFIKTKIEDQYVADDILQEVGIKLYGSLIKNVKTKDYRAWLFQVTRNTIADYYRGRKVNTPFNANAVVTNDNSGTCICDLLSFVIKKYLPQEYGEPLYLSDIEQVPQQEIARTLNLSLSATKSRIQRGRKKLKELVSTCVDVSYNNKGQISDFQLKKGCELPKELIAEMDRINLFL